MACKGMFRERLKESGLRLTPQREMVLDVLHQLEGAATADMIYDRVSAISSAVDISTIYRTLDLLREFSLVACIDPGGDPHRYELLGTHGPHLHLACQLCGAIVGVDLDEAKAFVDHLYERYGFEARFGDVTIPGMCRDCRTSVGE